MNIRSELYLSFSKLGRHAYLIIGGGPQSNTTVSSLGGGKHSDIIESVINPDFPFQSSLGRSYKRLYEFMIVKNRM